MDTLNESPGVPKWLQCEEDVSLTPDELSNRWKGQITAGTMSNWRNQGIGPRYFRPGGGSRGPVLYRLSDVREYENRNTHQSTAEEEITP
jgi:hypothetical protein